MLRPNIIQDSNIKVSFIKNIVGKVTTKNVLSTMITIQHLPTEVLELIFSKLCLKDASTCFQTCVRWSNIIRNLYKNKGTRFSKLIYYLLNENLLTCVDKLS